MPDIFDTIAPDKPKDIFDTISVSTPTDVGLEGAEPVSGVQRPEEIELLHQQRQTRDIARERGLRALQVGAIQKLPKQDRLTEFARLDPLSLLEAASDIKLVDIDVGAFTGERTGDILQFGSFRDRQTIIQILRAKGVPRSAVADFVAADRGPQGLEGFLKKEAIPTTGEIAGGAIGLKFKKPVRGAMAGRAVGEAVQRAMERLFITERQKTIGDDINDAGINVALAGLGEYGSQKLVSVGATILKPAGRTRKAGARELAEELFETGKRVTAKDIPEGIGETVAIRPGGMGLAVPPVIPPGQLTNKSLFQTFDTISESAITSSQAWKEGTFRTEVALRRQTSEVLESFANELVERLSPSQIGAVLDDVIQGDGGAIEAARGIYRHFYTQLDDLGVGAVSNTKAKSIAQKLVDLVSEGKILKGSDEGASFVANVADLAEDSSFAQAITNRSTILDWARKFDAAGERNAARLARDLGTAMDDSMSVAAKAHGEVAHRIWRRGNATFKAVHKRFDTQVITKLAKEAADNPELAVKTIFKNQQPSRILKVKKALLSPSGKTVSQIADGKQTWLQLKHVYVNHMLSDVASRGGALQRGTVFGKGLLNRLDDMGDDALKVIFDPEEITRLRKLGKTGALIQNVEPGKGGMFITLAQPAAIAGVVAGKGRSRAASIGLLSVPPVWAKMALDPKMNKFLVDGLLDLDKFGPRASTAATAKVLRVYFKERDKYFKEQTEKQKEEAKIIRDRIVGRAREAIPAGQRFRLRGLQTQ